MTETLEALRAFSFGTAALRLTLALLAGALLGYGRARKRRNAGLRTYMLVSVGAALTILIAMYEYQMLSGPWAWAQALSELKFDGGRYAAGVVSGIGFLAAGTILGVDHQQVSGLTSAIGLFTAAAIGLAAGAGFYELVVPALLAVVFSMETLQPVEVAFKRRLRNITISVEFNAMEDLDVITGTIQAMDAQVFEVDVERTGTGAQQGERPSAILTLKLGRGRASHSALLSSVAELECVRSVLELIS